jgi:hypothetical protein
MALSALRVRVGVVEMQNKEAHCDCDYTTYITQVEVGVVEVEVASGICSSFIWKAHMAHEAILLMASCAVS